MYIIILFKNISIVLNISSHVLNKREKGVVFSRRKLLKFWTLC